MATIRAANGLNLRAGNVRKGIGLLLIVLAIGAVLLLVPALRKPPVTDSFVNLPAMSNPPPPGSLHIETAPAEPGGGATAP